MTNKDKFIEVFGQRPDIDDCPVYCASSGYKECPGHSRSGCGAGWWWNEEYKEENENDD